MKKLVALLLAVLMLSVSFAAMAEVPEGYPEIVPEMIQETPITIGHVITDYNEAYQAYIEWSSLTAQEQADKIQKYQEELAKI